jgi:hypothetical protein
MIKNPDMRDLIANDGEFAVVLVEKLAGPQLGIFGALLRNDGPSFTEWLGSQRQGQQGAQRFGATTAGAFGTSGARATRAVTLTANSVVKEDDGYPRR